MGRVTPKSSNSGLQTCQLLQTHSRHTPCLQTSEPHKELHVAGRLPWAPSKHRQKKNQNRVPAAGKAGPGPGAAPARRAELVGAGRGGLPGRHCSTLNPRRPGLPRSTPQLTVPEERECSGLGASPCPESIPDAHPHPLPPLLLDPASRRAICSEKRLPRCLSSRPQQRPNSGGHRPNLPP